MEPRKSSGHVPQSSAHELAQHRLNLLKQGLELLAGVEIRTGADGVSVVNNPKSLSTAVNMLGINLTKPPADVFASMLATSDTAKSSEILCAISVLLCIAKQDVGALDLIRNDEPAKNSEAGRLTLKTFEELMRLFGAQNVAMDEASALAQNHLETIRAQKRV